MVLLLLHENVTMPLKFEMTGVAEAWASVRTQADGSTDRGPRLIAGTSDHYPVDTLLAFALWAWCAGDTLIRSARLNKAGD